MRHRFTPAPRPGLTRRNFLDLAGATTIGLAASGLPAFAQGRENKPNVIVIVLDTLRRDHLGLYGNTGIRSTAIDTLGAQSLVFTRATPEAMPTIPARRAIHSGFRTWPFNNFEKRAGNGSVVYGWQHIPDNQPTLAEQMTGAGYYSMMVTDVPHMFQPGMNFTRGFSSVDWIRGQEGDPYQPPWMASDTKLQDMMAKDAEGGDISAKYGGRDIEDELRAHLANTYKRRTEEDFLAPQVFRSAAAYVENAPLDQPWFLVVDSFDPHEPWDAPDNYVRIYDREDWNEPEPLQPTYGKSDYLTDRQLERMRTLYKAEVTMADRWLGWFLDRLNDSGRLDDAAVVLLSDHGMALGEHGWIGKPSEALWGEMTDVPFLLKMPGTSKPAKTDLPVMASTHDVAPTVLSIAGIEPKAELPGMDLTRFWDNPDAPARDFLTSGLNNHVWGSDGTWTLHGNANGEGLHLYNRDTDPGQMTNLADAEPERVRAMFDRIKAEAGGDLPYYPI